MSHTHARTHARKGDEGFSFYIVVDGSFDVYVDRKNVCMYVRGGGVIVCVCVCVCMCVCVCASCLCLHACVW